MIKQIKIKKPLLILSGLFTLSVLAAGLSLLASPTKANAIGLPPSAISATSSCGDQSQFTAQVLVKDPVVGQLYVRMPQYGQTSNLTLYSAPLIGGCQAIGSATATTTTWTPIGNVNLGKYSQLEMQGQNLGAEPYAAAAEILVVPDPGICQPGASCTTTYSGMQGSIEPKLISGTTDQIAVYQVQPIANSHLTSVDYYSDGTFLYASKQLKPINHNYLGGGNHAVVVQANFANGEKFVVHQTINMGTDWSGTLYLRSLYYRSHNKLAFFLEVGAILLGIALLLWFIRHIYHHHLYNVEHGLDHYKRPDKGDGPSSQTPVIGDD